MSAETGGERLTVPGLVRRWADEQPDRDFVVTDDDALTYGELERRSAALAAHFADLGVGKGTPVGVLMTNGTAWPVVAFGASRAGATVVPLSTFLRPPELAAQLRTAGVEHLVLQGEFLGRDYVADLMAISPELVTGTQLMVDAVPRLRTITVWEEHDAAVDAPPRPELVAALDATVRPADDLAIVFTSGSRGTPKGVIHTHGGALAATESGLDVRRLTRDDRLYIPMPFFWVGGFGTGLLSALLAGATLLTEARPEPARTLPFLERNRVTLFRGWPDQAAALARDPGFAAADLSALRPGSLDAVMPAEVRAGPGQRAGLLGMTESFGPYSGYRLDQTLPPGKEGSCGQVFDGVELRVVDLDTGARVADGETGELQLRGPNLMRGICGRTRAEVFTEDGFYAHRRRGSPRRRRVPVPHRPSGRHVQGAGRDRLPERGRGCAARVARGAARVRRRRGGAGRWHGSCRGRRPGRRRVERIEGLRATPSNGSVRSRSRPAGTSSTATTCP